jgi:Mg/Co/Ni transporter MgtE
MREDDQDMTAVVNGKRSTTIPVMMSVSKDVSGAVPWMIVLFCGSAVCVSSCRSFWQTVVRFPTLCTVHTTFIDYRYNIKKVKP